MPPNLRIPSIRGIRNGIENPQLIREYLIETSLRTVYIPYASAVLSITSRYPIGTNIFESDWDLLIILDTCRADVLKEVKSKYEFINNVNSVVSVGSKTHEWTAQTFRPKYNEDISETVYLSGHPGPYLVLDQNLYPEKYSRVPFAFTKWDTVDTTEFKLFDRTWLHNNNSVGHPDGPIPPQVMTKRAIDLKRTYKDSKFILHYVQPHAPYTSQAIDQDRDLKEYEASPFRYLRKGGEKEKVWCSYRREVEYVLDSIKKLLRNFDAGKVIITSDHGEGFGEWFAYNHPSASFHSKIRRVPWVETSSVDNRTITGSKVDIPKQIQNDTQEQLKQLGYL